MHPSRIQPIGNHDVLNFFYKELEVRVDERMDPDETLYIASILAHYARTSAGDQEDMPLANDLRELFQTFILAPVPLDAHLLELAGSQSLMLAGFFRNQMQEAHNLAWYDSLGRRFYSRAGRLAQGQRRLIFLNVARHFPFWTLTCSELSRELRENSYLLRI